MKIKVSEATDLQIDWLVTTVEDPYAMRYGVDDWREQRRHNTRWGEFVFRWCSSWMQGGPIIERERLMIQPLLVNGDWFGEWRSVCLSWEGRLHSDLTGITPLVAAMRCFIVSKLGEEVEVPDELA